MSTIKIKSAKPDVCTACQGGVLTKQFGAEFTGQLDGSNTIRPKTVMPVKKSPSKKF